MLIAYFLAMHVACCVNIFQHLYVVRECEHGLLVMLKIEQRALLG